MVGLDERSAYLVAFEALPGHWAKRDSRPACGHGQYYYCVARIRPRGRRHFCSSLRHAGPNHDALQHRMSHGRDVRTASLAPVWRCEPACSIRGLARSASSLSADHRR